MMKKNSEIIKEFYLRNNSEFYPEIYKFNSYTEVTVFLSDKHPFEEFFLSSC